MRGVAFLHPWRLALLALALPLYAAWRRWPPPLPGRRRRVALGLRLALVATLVLALAGLRLPSRPARRAVVAVVDLSDSTVTGTEDAATMVRSMAAAKGPDDLFGVVTFGRDAQVELPPSAHLAFDRFQTRPDGSFSDLAGALQLAANLIPEGYGRQLVLLSDGRQNLGDAPAAVAGLRAQSVRVDVLPIGAAPRPDAAVLGVEMPAEVRTGQALSATVRLRSTGPADAGLSVQVDGREVARRAVALPPGVAGQTFDLPMLDPGTHQVRAVLDASPDGYAQNDVAEAVVRVVDRPRVLLVEAVPGAAANMSAAVQAAGIEAHVVAAEDVPTDAAGLAGYDSTVLVDVPADALAPEAQAAIAASVGKLGRGLVAVGGGASYGPGGWKDTPIEETLPVRMDIPARREKPSVAVALVMETMEDPQGDGVALGAARSVVDQLGPEDEIAVVDMHQAGSFYAVPLTPVVDREAIKRRIEGLELGDPPGYGPPLQLALDAVAKSTAATKHVILIGDGDATADVGRYESLLAGAPGATVSVVGVDTHKNPQYMAHASHLARLGGGRFYQSADGVHVPEILLKATRDALRPWFEDEPFFPKVTSAGDLLAGVPLDAFPALGGYVATTAKAEAEVVLASPKGDPVLAGWQHGLGRAVAWTSDSRGRWTGDLLGSPVSAALFGRMVAWSLAQPASDGTGIEAVTAGDGLDVVVTGPEQGADVDLEVVGPGPVRPAQALRSAGPGRWEGHVPTGELGTYVLHATVRRGTQVVAETEHTVAVPYSPEYLDVGRDDGFLARLARGAGSVLARPGAVWGKPLPLLRTTRDAFWLLILLAAALWPLDVAARRLTLTPGQALSTLRSLVARRGRSRGDDAAGAGEPAGPPTLKERLDQLRR